MALLSVGGLLGRGLMAQDSCCNMGMQARACCGPRPCLHVAACAGTAQRLRSHACAAVCVCGHVCVAHAHARACTRTCALQNRLESTVLLHVSHSNLKITKFFELRLDMHASGGCCGWGAAEGAAHSSAARTPMLVRMRNQSFRSVVHPLPACR